MKSYLATLRVPLAIEATNILVHRIFHWSNHGNDYVDGVSLIVTALMVFFASWLVARQTLQVGKGVYAGVVVWAICVAAVVSLVAFEVFVLTPLPRQEAPLAIAGFAVASVLFLPVVLALALAAAVVAKRTAP